ncbi:hypothetical protein ACVWZA_002352 [Sphingomonas sp. UYAg733]
MSRPRITIDHIGLDRQPLACIDDFAPDPDALRNAAIAARFGAAAHHYPGIRAILPPEYFGDQQPVIDLILGEVFGRHGATEVIDASYSIVTRAPAALTVRQRLPHVDAFGEDRIALIHYLSPEGGDGTAFFRHRSTGFETVDEARSPAYFDRLNAELRDGGNRADGYIDGDTTLFERTMLGEARYNRAFLYRSYVLHSGAIAPDAPLSPDPATGRLTVTAFLSVA